jgi:metal-dependent hydrolase (beta-lactamase superfamily II)
MERTATAKLLKEITQKSSLIPALMPIFLPFKILLVGLKIRVIDIVINTHEHFDHIGDNRYFQDHAIIAAHRFAATRMILLLMGFSSPDQLGKNIAIGITFRNR